MKFRYLVVAAGIWAGLTGCATTPVPVDQAQPAPTQQGQLVADGLPERSATLTEQLRPYQNTRPASLMGWLPDDGGVLVSVRFGDVPQLAKVTQPGGMRTQLTFFDEPIVQAWVSPSSEVNGAIFAKDSGGDENFQLHFLSFGDGSTRLLTDGQSRNERVVFAANGQHFAYASTRRNGRDFDIWMGNASLQAPHRLLLQQGGSWYPLDFSPDGRKLLVQQWFSISDARLHLVDIETGELTRVAIGRDSSAESMARFDHDGAHLLVLTDALGEFASLVRVELATGVVAPLFPQQPWDVENFDISEDGSRIAVVRNVDGSSHITVHDRGNALAELSSIKFDQGVVTHALLNHAGTEIGFDVSGAQIPGDAFSRTLNSGILTRWTIGETGGLNADAFVSPTTIRFGAHDTDAAMMNLPRQIPAHVYTPRGQGPFPVLILIHGGPEAQARPAFSEFIQFLVRERQVAVVVPNVRGSAGYGKTYRALDDGRKREDAVADIGSLISWLGVQPQFDPKRIGVYGGSYGGYMVLASLAQFSDRLRAGVDVVGISNFVTFLENTSPYRVDQRRPEYGDERDPDMRKFLTSISPLTRAEQIRQPLFVIQGANDPRVPRSEAEQILKAVRGNGLDAWFLLAQDEGHGFRKKANRDRMNEAVIQFLDQYLLPTAP